MQTIHIVGHGVRLWRVRGSTCVTVKQPQSNSPKQCRQLFGAICNLISDHWDAMDPATPEPAVGLLWLPEPFGMVAPSKWIDA